MEFEFFCKFGEDLEWFVFWCEICKNWLFLFGMFEESMCFCDYGEEELFYYSNVIIDIEFKFLFGWGEFWGVVFCIDFDLKCYMEYLNEDFNYIDL